MARYLAILCSRALAIAALFALAVVMVAGTAQAHEWAPHDGAANQETAVAADFEHCPMGASDCEGETNGSSMPCSGMSSGHCPQAGVSLAPVAFDTPVALSGNIIPLADQRGNGVFAPVDTPPPRA